MQKLHGRIQWAYGKLEKFGIDVPICVSHPVRPLGQALMENGKPDRMVLSRKMVEFALESVFAEVVNHEIAHFLDLIRNGSMSGHGPRFAAICEELGIRADSEIFPEWFNWIGECRCQIQPLEFLLPEKCSQICPDCRTVIQWRRGKLAPQENQNGSTAMKKSR